MKKEIKLSLSIDEAKMLHNGANQKRKKELEELFPDLKPQLITNRVKTYEDALRILRNDHFDIKNLYLREIARRKLEIIIEALNEGWKPNWEDRTQLKWYPSFYSSSNGPSFSHSYYSLTYAFTTFGVRLFCKSEETANYVGQQFLYLYKEMLLG